MRSKLGGLRIPSFCGFKLFFVIFMLLYIDCFYFSVSKSEYSPFPSTLIRQVTISHKKSFYNEENVNFDIEKIEINCYNVFHIFILCFVSVILFWMSCHHLCNDVSYITFDTNLNLFSKKKCILKSP